MKTKSFTFFLLLIGLIGLNQRATAQYVPSVEVIQPSESNIEWLIGNTYLISWTDNFTQPVNIDLVDYDNAAAVTPIASNVQGSTYAWEISNGTFVPGTKYKVRVSSSVVSSFNDESENFFTLAISATGTTVHVEQPNIPDLSWQRGTTHLLSWIDNIPGKVNIELINDEIVADDDASFGGYAGGAWGQGTNGGFGFEPWLVEYTPGTDGRVADPASIGIVGMDNPAFYLASTPGAHIYTDRPFAAPLAIGQMFSFDLGLIGDNGGTGTRGVELYASYTSVANPGTKIIDIEQTSGNTISINGTPMFENDGVNSMTIYCVYESVGNLRVYGTGRDGSESFNTVVSVAAAPDAVRFGTENMTNMDASRHIFFNNLRITYADVNLATNVVGTTYLWEITSTFPFGDKFKIKVISVDDPTIEDMSDNYFAIVATNGGTVEVLQPNFATEIVIGTPYLISWIDNLAEKVTVELVKYVGGSAVSFTRLTPVGGIVGSTFIWNVPNDANLIHGTYKIKVMSTIDANIQDKSDNYFSIVGSLTGTVEVIQPSLNNIEIVKGSQYLISWVDNLSENVVIELVKYDGSGNALSFTAITPAGGVSGSTYVWNVPNDPALVYDHYKIKVVSINNGTIQDKSNFEFKIIAHPEQTVEVIQPNISDIQWVVGNQYLISWVDNIWGNVKIDLCNASGNFISNIATEVEGSTYVWTTTGVPTGSYKIRVSSMDDNNVTGVSDHPFQMISSVAGTIEVLQPNGGETLWIGESYLISWIDNITENVNIKVYQYSDASGNGQVARYEFTNVPGSTMIWNVLPLYTGSYFKVRIKSSDPNSATPADWSDGYFAISPPIAASVFPNPASDYFTIRFAEQVSEDFQVVMYDRFNNQMINLLLNATTKDHRISTAQMPDGVYFLRMTSGTNTITQKIIVQH